MFRTVLILVSAALLPSQASAQTIERVVKDAIRHEMERRVPAQSPILIFDEPAKMPKYDLNWKLAGRIGPFSYQDNLNDSEPGKFAVRFGSMRKFQITIRKDF